MNSWAYGFFSVPFTVVTVFGLIGLLGWWFTLREKLQLDFSDALAGAWLFGGCAVVISVILYKVWG